MDARTTNTEHEMNIHSEKQGNSRKEMVETTNKI